MKKFICLVLVAGILASSTVSFALETESVPAQVTPQTITAEQVEIFNDIPVYVTYINDFTEEKLQSAKENSTENVKNLVDGNTTVTRAISDEYQITDITSDEKFNLLTSPIFTTTFERVQELIDDGTHVKYVNVFLPNTNALAVNDSVNPISTQEDDPAYWESICLPLGTYNGYKFLYVESAIGIETSLVNTGNISGNIKWDVLIKKGITAVADHFIKGTFYKTYKFASATISTLIGSYTPPYSVTYSESKGYVQSSVSGDLYTRMVMIRDDNNRVQGYAYYPWGSTEKLVAALHIKLKYPVAKNPSGTYNFEYKSGVTTKQNTSTIGYLGNSTLYASIISLYENEIGYFEHNESIDIDGIISELLN